MKPAPAVTPEHDPSVCGLVHPDTGVSYCLACRTADEAEAVARRDADRAAEAERATRADGHLRRLDALAELLSDWPADGRPDVYSVPGRVLIRRRREAIDRIRVAMGVIG